MKSLFFASRRQRVLAIFDIIKLKIPVRLKTRICFNYFVHFFAKRIERKPGEIKFLMLPFFYPDFRHLAHLFSEVYIHLVYAFKSQRDNPFIIDLGANIGMSSILFKNWYPKSTILAIEANPTSFSYLSHNLHDYQGVSVFNKAASNKIGSVNFFIKPEEPGSGQNSTIPSDILTQKIEVESILLSSLIDQRVDLLKMDIEGGELAVFRDLISANSFSLIDQIIMEYHFQQGGMSGFEFVTTTLKNAGYQVSFGDQETPLDLDNIPPTIMVYARNTHSPSK